MNKWKIRFYILLLLLVCSVSYGYYTIVDQSTSISYMKDGYADTEKDLNMLVQILNEKDFSYSSIKESVSANGYFIKGDENERITLNKLDLVFNDDKLIMVDEH